MAGWIMYNQEGSSGDIPTFQFFLFFCSLFAFLLFAPTYEGGVVSNGLPSRFQSVMWFMMSLVAESGVSCRPMHSTKSPSGSWSEQNMSVGGLITNEDME